MNIFGKDQRSGLPFPSKIDRKKEKCGFIYAWAEYYLQPNKVGRRCARADHYLYAFICMSRGGLSANEKEEKFASKDNGCCLSVVANVTETCL